MRRRLLVVGGGMAALLLAIVLALLGRAVLDTPAAVARETEATSADVQVGSRDRTLADRAAWDLLGAGRAKPFVEIVRIYRTVTALPALAGQPTWSVRIAGLIPKVHAQGERAQAYVMAGTLLALGAGDGLGIREGATGALSPQAKSLLSQAVGDFRAALAADPSNEEAKYDLELLLKQERARQPKPGRPKRSTTKPKPAGGTLREKVPLTQSKINDAGIYATGSGY